MMMFREGAEDCQFLMKSESLKDAIVGRSFVIAQLLTLMAILIEICDPALYDAIRVEIDADKSILTVRVFT